MMRSVGAFSLSFSTTDMKEKAKGDDEFGDIAGVRGRKSGGPERGDLKIFSARIFPGARKIPPSSF